eukprot:scaffold41425_cov191-Isochrysis_galbana.AAC.2
MLRLLQHTQVVGYFGPAAGRGRVCYFGPAAVPVRRDCFGPVAILGPSRRGYFRPAAILSLGGCIGPAAILGPPPAGGPSSGVAERKDGPADQVVPRRVPPDLEGG